MPGFPTISEMELRREFVIQMDALRTVLGEELREVKESVTNLADEMKAGYQNIRNRQRSVEVDIQQLQDQILAIVSDEKKDDSDDVLMMWNSSFS